MRTSEITRNTFETEISLYINLDGSGKTEIETGCGFLDHMLTLFAHHANVDLKIKCKGDVNVDYHHTTEDIGIVLGSAIKEALSDMKGINRYGSFILPMDEALIMTALDFSGRCHLSYNLAIPSKKVGDFDTELVREFFEALTRKADMTLHINQMAGKNSHHIIEGTFKSFARSLKMAVAINSEFADRVPSTKGVI